LLLVLGGAVGAVLVLPMLALLAMPLSAEAIGEGKARAFLALALAVAALVLAYLLARLLLSPIRALAAWAAAVPGRGAAPLPHYGTRELGELGRSVLDMARALENRAASIRSFTDHVTHELKTPLTAIRGAAEMLAASEGLSPEDRRLADMVLASAARMEVELAALRRVAAAREPGAAGETTLDALAPGLRADFPGLELAIEGGGAALPLVPERLKAVLAQLLGNSEAHGARRVVLRAEAAGALDISDDGPGISPGNRERIFEPFFTTRREAGGTGMGLPIAEALLAASGAAIALVPGPGGARFRIEF
jgi:signal transduction histidine kinase